MAIGSPVFLGLGRSMALNTEVNNVAATLALTRQWAITHKETLYFKCGQINQKSWYVVARENRSLSELISDTNNFIITNLNGDAYFANSAELTFKPNGSCEGIGTINISISNRNQKIKTIKVQKLTGTYKIVQ